MKKLLLPLILLIVGTGGGVGAAMFLAPPVEEDHAEAGDLAHCPPPAEGEALHAPEELADDVPVDPSDPAAGFEYARLNNQFIVPVVQEGRVSALVVLTLSIEVEAGQKERVFEHEPRLRDALLQVMFDHANQGGFDGVFTASDNMGSLRAALRNVARQEAGTHVTDVLVLDVVRQEVPA